MWRRAREATFTPEVRASPLARTPYEGLAPATMIRRRRLQEAADRLRTNPDTTLAAVAADLGYSDHAHLANEFRSVLGLTLSSYRQRVTPEATRPDTPTRAVPGGTEHAAGEPTATIRRAFHRLIERPLVDRSGHRPPVRCHSP